MRSGALILLALLAVACGNDMMTGREAADPGMMDGSAATVLASVEPAGSASSVAVNAPIVLRFTHSMAAGMEQYLALHEGDVNGPVVPMTCSWSGDRTTLRCTPSQALKPATRYTIHMGGGMLDANGRPIDMTQYGGMPMGGQWAMPGMMGGNMPASMMGSGWSHPSNGSYGMLFTFTTAG